MFLLVSGKVRPLALELHYKEHMPEARRSMSVCIWELPKGLNQ